MEVKSFDTILTQLCDDFDTLISPRKIARTNTNIIYLIFKAIAKGFEVINNLCVVLNNKFDPAKCSSEDLESISALVGTNRFEGSASGLYVKVANTTDGSLTLLASTYYYALDDDTTFYFEVLEDTVIAPASVVTFIAMSENIGVYPVTAQTDIAITSEVIIPTGLTFSCDSNEDLLGTARETDLELRKRIIEGTDNQDSVTELERTLKNLPYLFDARCKYNQEITDITYDGVTIPPFGMAIFYAGMPRNEIAEVVASKLMCLTVSTEDSTELSYYNEAFASGRYAVNIIPFRRTPFSIKVYCNIDERYVKKEDAKAQVTALLRQYFNVLVHRDYVKEEDVYNALAGTNISGFTLLGINLVSNGSDVDYIRIPLSRIAELENVTFLEE